MNIPHTRGFSLVEMIIVIFISSAIMLAVYQIYITFSNSYLYQNASINGANSAALFLNEFNDLSLQADAIVDSKTISGTAYTSGSTTVIFELPAINGSGDIVAAAYDYAVFYGTSTSAYRVLDANASSARVDSTKKLSDVLSNLTFMYDNASPSSASSVTADITTKTTVKAETFTTHLKRQVYLRNK